MMFDKPIYEREDFTDLDSLPETIERTRFVDCRFNGLSFADTRLRGAVFERCSFDGARISGTVETCAFLNCSFRYANLLGAEFDGCKMTGSIVGDGGYSIIGGDWSYTTLTGLRMKKRKPGAVNFTGASMFDCRFESCDLAGSKFDNVIADKLDLRNSDISGASFAACNFASISFKGCTADLEFAILFTRAHGIKI